MLLLVLLVTVGTLATSAHAQNWTVIPLPTTQSINAINSSFSNRFIVGDSGFVAESDASLLNWTQIDVGTSADLLALHRPAGGQVWVSGDGGAGRVLHTGSWHDGNIPSGEDFVVFSRSSGWSFAAGTGGSIYRSTNLGASWNLQTSGTTNALRDGNGFVGSLAFAVGDNGTILKTTNGGLDWVPKPSGTTADLHAYLDVASGVIAAAGENGTILRSTDGGESWVSVPSGTTATLYDMTTSFVTGSVLMAVGEAGTVIKSTDMGLTWCSINSETSVDLYACEMSSNTRFLVMGAGGYMALSETDGGGCVNPSSVDALPVSTGLELRGPWPLPLVKEGRFELEVDRSQRLRGDIIDASGRRIVSLFDAAFEPGESRTIRFDTASWTTGVYFIRVASDASALTRRAVVVR